MPGSGELLVLNGAEVTIGGDLDIATSGGSGNIDIDGTGGALTIGGNIVVGANGAAVLTVGLNSTLTQDNGGVIAGSNFTENVYGNLDPLFSGGGSVNILTSKTVAYSAYVANTTFNVSPGVAFTLQSPTIYGATGLNVGQTGDSSGSELTLNVGLVRRRVKRHVQRRDEHAGDRHRQPGNDRRAAERDLELHAGAEPEAGRPAAWGTLTARSRISSRVIRSWWIRICHRHRRG